MGGTRLTCTGRGHLSPRREVGTVSRVPWHVDGSRGGEKGRGDRRAAIRNDGASHTSRAWSRNWQFSSRKDSGLLLGVDAVGGRKRAIASAGFVGDVWMMYVIFFGLQRSQKWFSEENCALQGLQSGPTGFVRWVCELGSCGCGGAMEPGLSVVWGLRVSWYVVIVVALIGLLPLGAVSEFVRELCRRGKLKSATSVQSPPVRTPPLPPPLEFSVFSFVWLEVMLLAH